MKNKCKRSEVFKATEFVKNIGLMSIGGEERLLSFLDRKTSIGKTMVEELRKQYFLLGESIKNVSLGMGTLIKGLISQNYIRADLNYFTIRPFVNAYCYAYGCSIEEFYEEKVLGRYEDFPVLIERRSEKKLKDALRAHLKDDELEVFFNHIKRGNKDVFDNGEEQRLVASAAERLAYFKEMVSKAIFEGGEVSC